MPDVEAGAVEIPERAYMVDASGRLDSDESAPDSVVVCHLLQLPYATEESVGLTDEEPTPGAPWLHHAGTCDAHVMWSETRVFPRVGVWRARGGRRLSCAYPTVGLDP
ncbi:MAG: hypothetical protein GWO12_12730 [Gemmatimonadetes bacterium]|uniref:Uncharacterized protein n=1 Tax=Candidatus Kutchimonas denitrificans TaxID=3056748 RepID=A0AAE4Z8U5_9BACT|nr:hypothetical protein [Candidatus Kutchimonas denitrificans]